MPKQAEKEETMNNSDNNIIVCVCAQLRLTLCSPMDCVACQAPLSMEFSRQEYWSGLPFPNPEDLPDSGIKLTSPASPASAGRLFKTGPPEKPISKSNKPKSYFFEKINTVVRGKR